MVYFILDVVAELDLRAIESVMHRRHSRGALPYSPAMMVASLLYAYSEGIFSGSRALRMNAKAALEDEARRARVAQHRELAAGCDKRAEAGSHSALNQTLARNAPRRG